MSSSNDPAEPIPVRSLDPSSVQQVREMLVLSVSFEHYAVRESEIDTLWSLADVASRAGDPGADYALVLLWEAHEALAHERLDDASRALEALEAHLRRGSTDPSSPVSSR